MTFLLAAHPLAWIALVPVWAFFLRLLSGLFGADIPTWRSAFLNVVFTGAAVFFVYDGSGFAFLHMFGFKYIEVPEGYGYMHWMLESPFMKWEVLGLVPGIRYLPILFALCVAGTLQVLMLMIPFRLGTMLFIVHWGLNLGALALVGFLQTLVQGEPSAARAARPSALRVKEHPNLDPQRLKGMLTTAVVDAELDAKKVPLSKDDLAKATAGIKDAKGIKDLKGIKDSKDAKDAKADKKKDAGKDDAKTPPVLEDPLPVGTLATLMKDMEPQLASLERSSEPFLQRVPGLKAQLNRGGWWFVLGVLALFSACWVVSMVKRIRRLTEAAQDGPPE